MDFGQFMGSYNFGSLAWKAVVYVGYAAFIGLLGVVGYLIYHYNKFRMDLIVFPVRGDASGGYSIGERKKNKVHTNQMKEEWTLLKPWFKGKTIEPFESKYIYPGNKVYAYKLQGEYFPAKINFVEGKGLTLDPVPSYIRRWQNNKHREINIELSKDNWWDQNKELIMTMATVFICMTTVAVVTYFTYKFVTGESTAIEGLTQAIKGLGGSVKP